MPENGNRTEKTYARSVIAKRVARVMAVQALYTVNIQGLDQEIDTVIYNLMKLEATDMMGANLNKVDEAMFIRLARGAFKEQEVLQGALQEFLSEDWKFLRLPKLVQGMLLVGAYELKFVADAKEAVIINEYLEIAKSFNHEGEVGFINKVLDSFSKKFSSI